MRNLFFTSFLLLYISPYIEASHLVGGDLSYECLGNNLYSIQLTVYKDCNATGPNVADFDNPAIIGIYEGNNLINVEEVFLDSRTNIPPVINNPCLQTPPNVCVEEGSYQFTIQLASSNIGYKLVYQRCCRNQTIVNLDQPGNQGATFSVDIPPSNSVVCNSSPSFNDFPPIAICANDPLVFDHSATDPDGDNIVYQLCAPLNGGSQAIPLPNPPTAPPYNNIVYLPGYNANAPLDANPGLSIDPNTGIITGTPTSLGQYVVGICAQEYRNGNLIGEIRRDFQFNVTDCESNVTAAIPVIDTDPNNSLGTAGVFVYECQDFTVDFVNNSQNGTDYSWDFGVAGTNQDKSSAFEPSYTFPDTGAYVVRLIVNEGLPCSDTTEVVVRIYPIFTTDFNFTDVCENQPASFIDLTQSSYGNVNSWDWNFGDGNTFSSQNPNHQYNQDGTYTVTLISRNDKGCVDQKQKEIQIFDTPNASFDNTPLCIGQEITFSNTSTVNASSISAVSWSFSNGQNSNQNTSTQIFNTTGNQNVELIVTGSTGCIDTLNQTIFINPLPNVNASNDTSICEGDIIQLQASGASLYEWSPITGLSNAFNAITDAAPTTTTNYLVTGTDQNECIDTSSVNVTVFPKPNTFAGNDTFICIGDSINLTAQGGVSFTWNPNSIFIDSTAIQQTISPDSSLNVYLESLSDKGCKNRDTIFLEVQTPIIKPDAISDKSICIGKTIDFKIPNNKYIAWSPPEYFTNPDSAFTTFNGTQNNNIQLNISNDCFRDSFQFQITVNPLPEVETSPKIDTIFRDELTSINVNGTAIDYSWNPKEGIIDSNFDNSVSLSPFNTTYYFVEGTDQNGCRSIDSTLIVVIVKNLIVVPSAFSPNNDGLNDFFRIIKALNIQSIDAFEIFNRWGQQIFSTKRLNAIGWDGLYKGEKQDVGVYVYKISATTKDGDKILKSGNLTLIR